MLYNKQKVDVLAAVASVEEFKVIRNLTCSVFFFDAIIFSHVHDSCHIVIHDPEKQYRVTSHRGIEQTLMLVLSLTRFWVSLSRNFFPFYTSHYVARVLRGSRFGARCDIFLPKLVAKSRKKAAFQKYSVNRGQNFTVLLISRVADLERQIYFELLTSYSIRRWIRFRVKNLPKEHRWRYTGSFVSLSFS